MQKLFKLTELIKVITKLKKQKKIIVMTNGCFDIIHAGHVDYLEKSKKIGDILIIAVNSDSSIRKLKGKSRPINKLKDRLKVLSALSSVDFVIAFNSKTPENIYKKITPNILTKGNEFKDIDKIAGANHVQKHGGKIKLIKLYKNYSTTKIISKIQS